VKTPVERGALIISVAPNSAAAIAGLRGTTESSVNAGQLGDIITAIDGQTVESGDDITKILDRKSVGDTVQLEIVREGRSITISVRLTAAPQS
jgi:S1-C subfamily serine protease